MSPLGRAFSFVKSLTHTVVKLYFFYIYICVYRTKFVEIIEFEGKSSVRILLKILFSNSLQALHSLYSGKMIFISAYIYGGFTIICKIAIFKAELFILKCKLSVLWKFLFFQTEIPF